MCKGTACIAERRHDIDAVVTVNVVEHQTLEIPICMLHGGTRKGNFSSDVKARVQYGENLTGIVCGIKYYWCSQHQTYPRDSFRSV